MYLKLLIPRYSAPQSGILARRGTQRRSRGFSREEREGGVSLCLSVRFHPPFVWKIRANYDQRKVTTDQCAWSVTNSSNWWQKAYMISFKVVYTSWPASKKRDLSNQSWRSNKIHFTHLWFSLLVCSSSCVLFSSCLSDSLRSISASTCS